MTGQSAAIAGLASCAASAALASQSFFMPPPPHPRPTKRGASYTKSPPLGVAARPQLSKIQRAQHYLDNGGCALTVAGQPSRDEADRSFSNGGHYRIDSQILSSLSARCRDC